MHCTASSILLHCDLYGYKPLHYAYDELGDILQLSKELGDGVAQCVIASYPPVPCSNISSHIHRFNEFEPGVQTGVIKPLEFTQNELKNAFIF